MAEPISQGTVHTVPDDLRDMLCADAGTLSLWQGLTDLGRNEFLCWIEDAKRPATRQRRIERTREELLDGKKRPCCWAGCIHRDDKPPGAWQQAMLIEKRGKAR